MKQRPGFSLVETLIALGLVGMVLTGAAMLSVNGGRSFDRTSAQLDADRGASVAVQRMMLDLQEAKQVQIISTTRLRVFFPQVAADGTYIRSALDSVNTIDFFRGTSAGSASATGDCLIRQPAGGAARVVCGGVTNIQFASTNPSSVDITVSTQQSSVASPAQCNMEHRAIFLRNY
jgi:prepilin-type N-terminal cleavage/methylation domain-containing protein